MGLVSNAWAGLGSAFGPIVVMSLFWRRTNFAGAVAGIVSGGGAVLIWDYLPLVHRQTLGSATRAVFTGGRICAEYSLHCDLQPLHEETISGDSGRVR